MNYENEEIELNLSELIYALWQKAIIIAVVTIVCGLGAGLFSYYMITPTYESTSMIYIVGGKEDQLLDVSALQVSSNITEDYIVLVERRPVVETVIKNLKLDMGYTELVNKVTATNINDTRIISITVKDTDPVFCKNVANEFAKVVQKQVPITMQTSEPTIVENAVLGEKVGPHNTRNALLGAIAGFVVTAGIIIFLHISDDSIKTAEDAERFLQINTLASIPEEGGTDNSEKHSKKKKKIKKIPKAMLRKMGGAK